MSKISELSQLLKTTLEENGTLNLSPDPSFDADKILRTWLNLSPRWHLLEDRQRRGAGVPVDLGLSVMWSSRNVGAKSGELPGMYVGWGDETGQKVSTSAKDYPVDHNIGGKRHDIARCLWAETWRIPNREEFQELIEKCRWIWTTINGISGFQVLGKTGNSIFLPATGSRYGSEFEDANSIGRYWTADLYIDEPLRAYYLEFAQSGPTIASMSRCTGMSIRPVLG